MLIETKRIDEKLFAKLLDLSGGVIVKERHGNIAQEVAMLQGHFPATYHGLCLIDAALKAQGNNETRIVLSGAISMMVFIQQVIESIALEQEIE